MSDSLMIVWHFGNWLYILNSNNNFHYEMYIVRCQHISRLLFSDRQHSHEITVMWRLKSKMCQLWQCRFFHFFNWNTNHVLNSQLLPLVGWGWEWFRKVRKRKWQWKTWCLELAVSCIQVQALAASDIPSFLHVYMSNWTSRMNIYWDVKCWRADDLKLKPYLCRKLVVVLRCRPT